MSLQGTIETFAIADVLRLLAATNKSGRLQVQGPSRSGTVWVDSGKILAAESPNTPYAGHAPDVLFQLLRFDRGSFRFELDRSPAQPSEPVEIEAALHDAEAMVSEWRDLEQSIPSTDAWVSLRGELSDGSVTISAEQWKSVTAVGSGRSVAELGDVLRLGELPTLRAVNELLQLGVVDVGTRSEPAPVPATAPPAEASSAEAPPVELPTSSALLGPPPADVPTPDDLHGAPVGHETAPAGGTDTGPIATTAPEVAEADDGETRRRLGALATSGMPPGANGTVESAIGSAPPAPPEPFGPGGPMVGFAPPPPPAAPIFEPEGVRAEAGLTAADANGSAQLNGLTEVRTPAADIAPADEQPAAEAADDHTADVSHAARVTPPAPDQPAPPFVGGHADVGPAAYETPAYGDAAPPAGYGDYGQPAGYGDYGQPAGYGDYGQPAGYGDYSQAPVYPAPPGYGQQYGDTYQPAAPEPGAWVPPAPPAPPAPEPVAETHPAGEEVVPGPQAGPTDAWASQDVTRARTIFESTAPPPPPPPPVPASGQGWPPAGGWVDGPAPERIAPPPPPPPPPAAAAYDPAAPAADVTVLTATGGDRAPSRPDEDAANIERQLLHLSERAREAVKRSSGLFDGRSRR